MRGLLFAAVLLVPVLALGWVFIDASRTGGVYERPDGVKFVNLQQMVTFPFDQRDGTVEQVPETYRQLDGERVALRGEMWVDSASRGEVENFSLVYSIGDCCFSGEPKVQHFVRSSTEPGRGVPLHRGIVEVVGKLRVDIEKQNGVVTGVYHLDVESVNPNV